MLVFNKLLIKMEENEYIEEESEGNNNALLVVSGYTIPEPAGHFLVYLDTDLSPNDAVFRLSTRVGRDCSTFIRGSCNGFIFYDIERFDGSHQLYLSNPITGESLTVPQPTKPCFKPILGFGFAPIAEVYKVVWIDENQDVNIFTVGSGIWREIGSLPCTPLRHTDFYLNGFLYWIARPRNTIFVSAFDVEESASKI
ncbi:hypothetical protein L3X38_002910 [Prunus dulcis]|uniref:F-box associated beta-propeller type 3 domain-containing protein n=1 Tax=Prunus dulcis TaxID=3755 RepID=A0AAD4ZL63_PRUDU|nr:hypothetical protein L3X38_002910 [Prunus dulcis]